VSPYRADTPATTELRFQARAATVRTLIRNGDIDPYEGLMLVVWPPAGVLAAEAGLSAVACYHRVRRDAA
jgi:hypothetical protein